MDEARGAHATGTRPVINKQYAARADKLGVRIQKLKNAGGEVLVVRDGNAGARSVLALSQARLNRLAIAAGGQAAVHDVQNLLRTHSVPSTGRTISSLAWSQVDPDILAVGKVDGTISIWSLRRPSRLIHCLQVPLPACQEISFSPLDERVLASSHGGTVAIWLLGRRSTLVKTFEIPRATLTGISWHPTIAGRLLTNTTDHIVRIWDVAQVLSRAVATPNRHDSDSEDDDVVGVLDGIVKHVYPIAQLPTVGAVATADWLGEYGAYVCMADSGAVQVYSFGSDWEMLHEVWKLRLDANNRIDAAVVRGTDGMTEITVLCSASVESHRIPTSVLDSVGGHGSTPTAITTRSAVRQHPTTGDSSDANVSVPRGMRPISFSRLRTGIKSPVKTPKRVIKTSTVNKEVPRNESIDALIDTLASPPSMVPKAMTSSLELPKLRDQETESPMPFLSPTIPARNAVPPLEESLFLPPLPNTSFDSVLTGSAHDSDSDDETYDGAMQNSATFLPGGINVPLPKACGALFAPNGQLLTFFPPKPLSSAARTGEIVTSPKSEFEVQSKRTARLFPTFGNLQTEINMYGDDTESNSSGEVYQAGNLPSFTMQPASFDSHPSWNNKNSPTKPAFGMKADYHKVVISIHDLEPVLPPCRKLAEGYHFLCDTTNAGSDVCLQNARAATAAEQVEVAEIWQLLAMLLEHKVPLQAISGTRDGSDILTVARRAMDLSNAMPHSESLELAPWSGSLGKLRWSDCPFGRDWLVTRILAWAEQRADIQLLACITAVLLETESDPSLVRQFGRDAMLELLPSRSHAYTAHLDTFRPRRPRIAPVPVLRADSEPSIAVYDSPTKLRQASHASSRNPSLPTTPHLDSTSSTPPLSLPGFSRQSSKLSVSDSGSGPSSLSPEQHRGSFSAAAKFYAQSITDKFASYGTSPPTKRAGTSPSTNELSSSVPTASGSWSKSVSFASTLGTAKDSSASQSRAEFEDGYDSDKTIDDSLPHTPRHGVRPITVNLPNADAFSDEISGCAQVSLLAPEVLVKAELWTTYYTEQLRSWNADMQAAELEKVLSLVKEKPHFSVVEEAVMPIRALGQRNATCSICFTLITKVEQLCPVCLHTNHPSCLAEYLNSFGAESFECPSGCGCTCSDLPFQPVELDVPESDMVGGETKPLKKKASFTDPRRWRARMDGESW